LILFAIFREYKKELDRIKSNIDIELIFGGNFLMNKIRLAQALVPIADELDNRNLDDEADELDAIIGELMSEAAIEAKMSKEAQQTIGPMPPAVPTQHDINVARTKIQKIDSQLLDLRRKEYDLQMKKAVLMQQGELPGNKEYTNQMHQNQKQLQATEQQVKQNLQQNPPQYNNPDVV